jgi:hypothetical protein
MDISFAVTDLSPWRSRSLRGAPVVSFGFWQPLRTAGGADEADDLVYEVGRLSFA